jgi:hypothetical protein
MSTEIADIINHATYDEDGLPTVEWYDCVKAADAVLAAGYRKPATVATPEELDALPVGSVVLHSRGVVWQKRGLRGRWYVAGSTGSNANVPYLPATVLHRGAE